MGSSWRVLYFRQHYDHARMRYWGRVIRQLVRWLNPRAGKLQIANQIYKRLLPRFVWVLSVFVWQSECLSSTIRFIFAGPILPARHFPRWSRVQKSSFRPFSKSFIDPACSVTMARYWPRSFLCCQWPRLRKGPRNTSHLDLTQARLYLIVMHVSVSHELILAAQ